MSTETKNTPAEQFLKDKGLKDTLYDVENPGQWIKGGLSTLLEEYSQAKEKELKYWRERCEAAEILVNSMSNHFKNDKYSYKYWNDWQQLKNQKPNSEQEVKGSDTTKLNSSTPDGKINSDKE